MRISYWSHSKFANALRKAFGLPMLPGAATMEQWAAHEKLEKETSPIGIKIIDSLDTIQTIVHWIPDSIQSVAYYLSNIKNKSNVLRTQVKFGSWGDLASRVPDGLMYAIIDFFEKECFWMNVAFTEKEKMHLLEPEVQKYISQSYLRRKLFGVKVSDEVRAKHARQWIDFQNEHDGAELKPYDELWEAYLFAKNKYFTYDVYDESGFTEATSKDGSSLFPVSRSPEVSTAFNRLQELENAFEQETLQHCQTVVKYHKYLWT